ncbi:Uncharacterised protein [Mycobacteroides abscessus subsp. abscessus]|nr:Uncharacterised protein [Mycobacteroides abscessus subsp. abscessus]
MPEPDQAAVGVHRKVAPRIGAAVTVEIACPAGLHEARLLQDHRRV